MYLRPKQAHSKALPRVLQEALATHKISWETKKGKEAAPSQLCGGSCGWVLFAAGFLVAALLQLEVGSVKRELASCSLKLQTVKDAATGPGASRP
jgi:hypothetical protein